MRDVLGSVALTRVWLRAHNVLIVVVLSVISFGVMAAAGNISFVAPRQPIPLVWPIATIQISALFLLLDTGFGASLEATVRVVLDRLLAVVALVAVGGVLISASSCVGAPIVLQKWLIVIGAAGLLSAAAGAREAWAGALAVGLVGIAAEFASPVALLSRLLADPGCMAFAAATIMISSILYIKRPNLRFRRIMGVRGHAH